MAAISLGIMSWNEWRIDAVEKAKVRRTLPKRRGLMEKEYDAEDELRKHLELFERSPEAEVIGPSAFPKPSDRAKKSADDEIVVNLKPVLGKHRPEKDAVLILAAEYKLNIYVQFIESLLATGYDGDIVLSVHEKDLQKADIREYLSYYSYPNDQGNVVVYAPRQVCFTKEMEQTHSANGGSRKCKLHDIFAREQADGSLELLDDPRSPRTVQNIRYETYWVMASAYNPNSWILLVDSRDTVFQDNPFTHLPRNSDPSGQSDLLYFFGESSEASRIGQSVKFNFRWIRAAYGDEIAHFLEQKPIICSGATMGEKIALETYLRAMVAEADETGTVLMGSDQGFHNRLYYSNKLKNADRIHSIVLFDQGAGIVNNLAALRTKNLDEWGNGKLVEVHGTEYQVKNWDGSIR